MIGENKAINKLIKKKDIRLIPQRENILEVFIENKEKHLSASDIYSLMKEIDKSIGMSTIYRTLNLLEEKGIIAKRDFDNDFARYEFIYQKEGRVHHHLICKKCGKVIEIPDILPADFKEKLLKEKGFQCDDYYLKVFGYCDNCNTYK